MSSKLEKMKQQQAQLQARIYAEQQKEKSKERKLETRKKIVIGGTLLAMVKSGELSQERLDKMLDKNIKSERDRSLLNLPQRGEG